MIQKISQLPGSIAALSCNGKDPDEQVYNIEIDVSSTVDGIVNCLGELLRPAPVKADKSAEDQGYGVVDEGQRKMEKDASYKFHDNAADQGDEQCPAESLEECRVQHGQDDHYNCHQSGRDKSISDRAAGEEKYIIGQQESHGNCHSCKCSKAYCGAV